MFLKRTPGSALVLVTIALLSAQFTFGQTKTLKYNTPVGDNISGFYEYLPANYETNTDKTYPLIIYLHGSGTEGNGGVGELEKIVNQATGVVPWRSWRDGLPSSFDVNGEQMEYVIIAPQFIKEPFNKKYDHTVKKDTIANREINDLLDYCFDNYRINTNKTFLTSNSLGSFYAINFIGTSAENAARITAIAICSPVYNSATIGPNPDKAKFISEAAIPVWISVAENDLSYPVERRSEPLVQAQAWVNSINAASPLPIVPAHLFILEGSWNHNSASSYTFDASNTFDGKSIYQWMLSYNKAELLPVAGLNLKIKSAVNIVNLSWDTQFEQGNQTFNVQRSADGKSFETIGHVNSNNASNGSIYEFTDNAPLPGVNYYRLEQLEASGKKGYSKIVSVNVTIKNVIKVYPNPVDRILSLELKNPAKATIRIYDYMGRLSKEIKTDGTRRVQIEVANLPKGRYAGQVLEGETTTGFSFIKN